jgi:thiol-disulfide isomerase/thioredoxin
MAKVPVYLADYFATWCNGCQRSYPELCKLAMDPDLHKPIKFVKVGAYSCSCIFEAAAEVLSQQHASSSLQSFRMGASGAAGQQ